MLEEKHENLPLMEFTFYTLFLSFNARDEKIWSDSKALHNYYGFPTRFAIMDQWIEFLDIFNTLQLNDKPYRVLSFCSLMPESEILLETDDTILEVLKIEINSGINSFINGNKETIDGPRDLELQVRSQWYNQKPLHRLFIQNQINKLLDKVIED